ncbi:hypothetical protein Bca52824_097123 [Brassica carinata]|uniref:Uncharacterized protein n=1 Tax=Brassica carinata TaxID=52824 RepID=A0A8X7TGA7_BRACI|nr:hypothetical protein Bca52824_097123 [Brassica carinata]
MLIKIHYTFIKLMLLISLILYSIITATSNPHSVVAEDITILVSQYKKIRKGMRCHVGRHNICNGVKADKGTSLLYCCKKHCRSTLGNKNNCGQCSHKCRFGQRCCGAICTYVGFNPDHCGKCNKKCKSGAKCEYGYCG